MKSVLISIRPKWCELIASGKKTIAIRKTRPKLDTPFKCYIYCTKLTNLPLKEYVEIHSKTGGAIDDWSGKVMGEFVCDNIRNRTLTNLLVKKDAEKALCGTCLSNKEVLEYLGYKENTSIFDCKHYGFYCWHISNLKIYDEPKELSEFNKLCDFNYDCFLCDRAVYDKKVITDISGKITKVNNKFIACDDVITRPPQSWCYCEEAE